MATTRPFGVSTFLFRNQRLVREHLLDIAAHGFETVELFAARTHLDYENPAVVADVQQWLGEAGLTVAAVQVPAGDDPEQALLVARRLSIGVLVVQAGAPRETARLVDRLAAAAAPLGVTVAIDSSSMTPPGSLVHFVEEGVDAPAVGVGLDFGRAHADGDLIDAIETVSGHLAAAHVHDSRGRTDEHLAPFDGTIEWPSAMTAVRKIGYDGPLVFDVAARGATRDALQKLQRARQRLEKMLQL